MARAGRKPLTTGHVENLDGSESAKQRLSAILETLRGAVTIPTASQSLGVCESRFHALRSDWLQQSLELLEPRKLGRPSKPAADPQVQQLEQTCADLRRELLETRVQLELQRSLVQTAVQKNGRARRGNLRAAKPR